MEINASTRVSIRQEHFASQQQEAIKALEKVGKQVINLGRGNPDQGTFPSIIEAFKNSLADVKNQGYPPYGGKLSLKKAIIRFYKAEYDVDLSLDEVTIFSGSLAALTALPMVLANAGEVVLSPDPAFFGYDSGIKMADAINYPMPLNEENHYFPTYADIPSDILAKAKMMFLNYPHNPTGKGATTKFFAETVDFARQHQIVVVHDFAYSDISFTDKAPSFLQAKGAKEVGIELFTLSKIFNMAGWRIAFAVGNQQVIKLLEGYIRASVGGSFGAVQDASVFALENCQQERLALQQLYADRQKKAIAYLAQQQIPVLNSEGSFFLWIKLPDGTDDVRLVQDLLAEQQVALIPGSTFGQQGKGFVRVSLVSDVKIILQGLARLATFLKEHHII